MSSAPTSVLMLAPAVKDYAWGDDSFIQGLLGAAPDGKPMAEASRERSERSAPTQTTEFGQPLSLPGQWEACCFCTTV